MREIELGWAHVLQVWWAYFWRGLVYMLLPAFSIGTAIGFFLGVNNVPLEPHAWKIQTVGGVIGLLVGIWLTKVILSKTYSGFRIALIAVPEPTTAVQQGAQAEGPASGGASA